MKHAMHVVLGLALFAGGCMTPQGATGTEKRQAILDMKSQTLEELYRNKPGARAEVEKAPGFAVFSNVGLSVIFVGAGNGYGVAVDNGSGKQTFMRMGQLSLELGIGLKDFRAVFVFTQPQALNHFVNNGWHVGGEAEAGFTASDKGGEAAAAGMLNEHVKVYLFTESGVILRIGIPVAKYWRYDELN